jgi:hypothetical protein
MTEEIKARVDSFTGKLRADKAERAVFIGHPLAECDDYVKNMYLKMLCSIYHYADAPSEAQTLFLRRVITSAKAEYSTEDYARLALEVTPEGLDEFIGKLGSEPDMKYSFVLDALLLTFIDSGNAADGLVSLIAEISDALRIDEDALAYLTKIGRAVLKLSLNEVIDAQPFRPVDALKPFLYYTRLCDSLSNLKSADFDNHEIEEYFDGAERLYFRDCRDISLTKPIRIKNCKRVIFENCSFEKFNTRTVELTKVESAEFNHCLFNHCYCITSPTEDWTELGGVIGTDNLDTSVKLNASGFSDCGEYSKNSNYSSSQIANANVSAVDCVFTRCYGSYRGNRDNSIPSNPKNRLFYRVSMNKNNKMEDCKNTTFCGDGEQALT